MTKEIIIQVLTTLDRQLDVKNRKVFLFLDNAPSHPETLQGNLKNMKLVFLSKNTTSQLQPCDTGIIRNFKVKYCNQLLNMLFQGLMMDKRYLKLFKRLIFYSI